MPVWLLILICVCGAVIFYCAIMLCAAFYVYKTGFGARFEKLPCLKYFTPQDFAIDAEPVKTTVGKITLGGNIYNSIPIEKCSELVIFAHGMGAGQCCYTTEIAYFCKHACAVLAFDAQGCTLSQGKKLGGMENAVKSLVAAVKFARQDARLKDKKIYLVGHSMGGYAVLCAAARVKVDGVVAFSALDNPCDIMCYAAKNRIGAFFAALIKPFIKLASAIKFVKYANKSAARAVIKSGVPALVFHGDCDGIVPLRFSAFAKLKKRGAAQCVLCEDKAHNPYNTFNAESLLKELSDMLNNYAKTNAAERDKFFSEFDFNAVCEEDAEVMERALLFIKGKD